jgi:hypothetical protein
LEYGELVAQRKVFQHEFPPGLEPRTERANDEPNQMEHCRGIWQPRPKNQPPHRAMEFSLPKATSQTQRLADRRVEPLPACLGLALLPRNCLSRKPLINGDHTCHVLAHILQRLTARNFDPAAISVSGDDILIPAPEARVLSQWAVLAVPTPPLQQALKHLLRALLKVEEHGAHPIDEAGPFRLTDREEWAARQQQRLGGGPGRP